MQTPKESTSSLDLYIYWLRDCPEWQSMDLQKSSPPLKTRTLPKFVKINLFRTLENNQRVVQSGNSYSRKKPLNLGAVNFEVF